MVSLKFIFNSEKLKASGYTEDELLQPMREHAEKYNIKEEEKGVFSKDGDDALCVLSMFIPDIVDKNPEYIGFLDEWVLDVDGEKEDCIQETFEWYRENEPNVALG